MLAVGPAAAQGPGKVIASSTPAPTTLPAPAPPANAGPAARPAAAEVPLPSKAVTFPTAMQRGSGGGGRVGRGGMGGGRRETRPGAEDTVEYHITTEPPGPDRLFQLESEAELEERMRQESRSRDTGERIVFPDEPILGRQPYRGRSFAPSAEFVPSHNVCYQRLLFEQINAERYDWDLGVIHPVVSAGLFFFDVATLPYHYFTRPCQHFECSAGYCLPGDPVPLLLYPPECSWTGAIAEAGTIAALFAIFP